MDAKSTHHDLVKEASSKLSRRELALIDSLEAREKMAVQMEGVHELEVQVFKCQDASVRISHINTQITLLAYQQHRID